MISVVTLVKAIGLTYNKAKDIFVRKSSTLKHLILLIFIAAGFSVDAQTNDYLLLVTDTIRDESGYVNTKGDTIIPLGKYQMCQTDTFKTHAIVLKKRKGWVAIDRNEKVLYKVFVYDNGSDYVEDGKFRITKNGRIGYADAATGAVVIKPKYKGAYPYKNGIAKVSTNCKTKYDGEHYQWVKGTWFHIDKYGAGGVVDQ